MADKIDSVLSGRLTRGELLKRAGAGAGVLMVPGLVSACGGGSTTTTVGATATRVLIENVNDPNVQPQAKLQPIA